MWGPEPARFLLLRGGDGTAGETMNRGEWLSLLLMGLLFVAPQMLALTAVNPFQDIGVRAFEDPGDPANILQIVVVVIAFTAFILVLARYVKNAVKYILLAVFFLSIFYILQAYLLVLAPQVALPLAGGLALTGIVLLALYPEWYVVDGMGVLVAGGIIAIFGVSLTVPLVVALLVVLAAYDALSVYKTRHMLSLADTVIGEQLPLLMVVPKTRGYSFLREKGLQEERDALFMGLGDVIIPGMLGAAAYGAGSLSVALATVTGALVGFSLLMVLVSRGNPQAGLPLLNTGAIGGFVLGSFFFHGSLLGF